jgi:hypothetical protein
MSNALSNPYEITLGGITCKVSPFHNGHFLANSDLTNLGDNCAKIFRDLLFKEYEVSQSRELDGIIIGQPKEK